MANPDRMTNTPEVLRPTYHVLAICVGSKSGGPMEFREEIVIDHEGVVGSRYPHNGYWSDKRIPNESRGVTLISRQGIEAANEDLLRDNLRPFAMDDTRRDMEVDIPPEILHSLKEKDKPGQPIIPGRRVQIGSTILEATDPCTPCVHLAELAGIDEKDRPKVVKAFLERGGMRFKVIQGGPVSKESEVEILG